MSEGEAVGRTDIVIPTSDGDVHVTIEGGRPLFLVGKNGSGKSALMHRLNSHFPLKWLFPGGRTSTFTNEQLSLNPASRTQLDGNVHTWDQQSYARWNPQAIPTRNEKCIYDLQAKEYAWANQAVAKLKDDIDRIEILSTRQPVDQVNAILHQSGLVIRLVMDGYELKAERNGDRYSIAMMSDGERSAVILAAAIVAASPKTVFLIDEPEMHIHAAIMTPLIKALILERSDCCFVVATHDLSLPYVFNQGMVAIIRSVTWLANGEAVSWDIDFLQNGSKLPEELFRDVLGARRRILFVEGTESSLDQPLYQLLFPEVTVHARMSCRLVRDAVTGLRADESVHRIEAFGLVDNDAMAQVPAEDGIYSTHVYSVESLYYSQPAIRAVAEEVGRMQGVDPAVLVANAMGAALNCLQDDAIAHLAARVAERRVRDTVQQSIPSHNELKIGDRDVNIRFASPYPDQLASLQRLVASGDVATIVRSYPIRESGMRRAIAQALRMPTYQDFERVVRQRVTDNKTLSQALREELGAISAVLFHEPVVAGGPMLVVDALVDASEGSAYAAPL